MLKATTRQKYIINLLLAMFALVNLWFLYIESKIRVPVHYMYSPIDDLIPFVPAFIVPYYIWYLYQAIPMLIFYFTSPESFNKIMLYAILSFAAACIIYMLYPNGIRLRPRVLDDSFFSRWVAFTYSKDSPVNSAPSIHVMMSIGMHLSLADYEPLRRHPWVIKGSRLLMVLICMSTVFVKQHSIIDVIMGCGISFILYLAIYRRKQPRKSFATGY